MIYSARFLVTMDGPPLPWGSMRVRDGVVTEVAAERALRPLPGEDVKEFPDCVLMPGLINAHCHLELGLARGLLPRGEPFPLWVSRLRKSLEVARPEQYREAARLGALECLKNGITTIVDVGNTGESPRALATLPIRSFPNVEIIGLDPSLAEARLEAALAVIASLPASSDLFRPGIACHAPFSCSPEMLRLAAASPVPGQGPFTMHVAESREETSMFRDGKGSLLEFCLRIFPALERRKHASPIAYLGSRGLIPKGSLFAHCNLAGPEDIGILSDTVTSVVHCPRSRAFFDHPDPPLGLFREAGVNVCLGTDSLASNEGLSIFDEMAELRRRRPEIPGRDILEMATVNAARALGLQGRLGCLRPGSAADFIAIHLRHHPEMDLHEEIVGEAHEVGLVAVQGEEIVY